MVDVKTWDNLNFSGVEENWEDQDKIFHWLLAPLKTILMIAL